MAPTAARKARAGVMFELERLDLEGDRLVVTGHWSGLRGLRFVRPTLVIGDRQVHATLEHKPWAPTAGEPWVAAFPWKQDDHVDASDLELAVAPSVTVPLVPRDEDERETEPLAELGRTGAPQPQADLRDVTRARDALREQLDQALARVDEREARCEQLEQIVRTERKAALEALAAREELNRARHVAQSDRARAIEQRDEAVRDLAAAVRTRARMERQHDEALAARHAAASELEQAIAEQGKIRAQRDEILVAYRALERHVHSQRADADRARTEPLAAAGPDRTEPLPQQAVPAEPSPAPADGEEPIGVRTIPAARTIIADLQRREPARKFVVSKFDLWAIRVLGSVAAGCFILLLAMILRVFV
jgi:hypothetical protein